MISAKLLIDAVGCKPADARIYADHLEEACSAYRINTPERLTAFLAQVGHESASLSKVAESLNYTPDGLLSTFGRRITPEQAMHYGRTGTQRADQRSIANIVYGGEWGRKNLGNTDPEDGWTLRGRGLIQQTGRFNIGRLRDRMRDRFGLDVPDFVNHPEELESPKWAAWSACDYWDLKGCNLLADKGDFDAITRKINGGMNGAEDRRARWERAKQAIVPAGQTEWDLQNPPHPEETMAIPAVLAALLPSLIEQAPNLIRVFGKGEMTERNAKAAEVVADMARKVTDQPTTEGAVQVLQANPAVAARFREEVHQSMGELLGLLAQAVDLDEKTRATAMDRNLELGKATGGKWLYLLGSVAILVVLASYVIVGIVLFREGFSDETKAMLLGQVIVMGFASVIGWMFGSNIANRIGQQSRERQ